MKIFLYMIDSRLRASARHGGAVSFFEFCLPIRRRSAPSGAAAIPVLYLNTLIFMRNAQCQSERSTGISLPALQLTPQNAITLKQVIRRYHKAQGRYGGTGTVPSVSLSVSVFHFKLKNSPEQTQSFFIKIEIDSVT
jgi:hypothetical protein